jgi:hypothetical protein
MSLNERNNQYTETTTDSWFSRLGSSIRGIGIGLILIIAATVLLWWNEGNFVATYSALEEANAVTQELGDISKLDASKNGQLVHATGAVETKDIITDTVFGLSVNAIRLNRVVEFYQWVENSHSETKEKLGGSKETVTTYDYKQQWVKTPVNSSEFKDPKAVNDNRNFVIASMENFKTQATNVTFGAYRLPDYLIDSIGGAVPLNVTLSDETISSLQKQLLNAAKESAYQLPQQSDSGTDNAPTVPSGTAAKNDPPMVHVSGNTVLLGRSPSVPQIGDVRVTFTETRAGTASIISKLNGDTFEPYRAGNGKTVSMLTMGTHSIENMYADAHSANTIVTWILRLIGIIVVIFGLVMILAPVQVFASVIPFLGHIAGAGTGIVSVLMGLGWSLLIIAIAWLRFRPVIGIGMIAVTLVLVTILYFKGKSRKKE